MKKLKFKNGKLYLSLLFLLLVFSAKKYLIDNVNIFNYSSFIEEYSYKTFNENDIEMCSFVRAKDGDTIVININGTKDIVRLVEIDTPESVHPDTGKNSIEGIKASNYVKSLLSENQILYLTKDITDRDQYGRLLRLVWLEKPISDKKEELRNKCLNVNLLLNGYAKVVMYDDYNYQRIFKEFEKEGVNNNYE